MSSSIGARLNARLGLKPKEPEKTIPSHRSTTSSRTPGRVNEGTVQVRVGGLRQCGDCGSVTSAFIPAGQHAVRWRGNELVNCIGRVLQ